MRVTSSGELPRLDLDALRRFLPALWDEWAALRFASDGRLLDADTGAPLSRVRLVEGRHRVPGARYVLADGGRSTTFTLRSDDRRSLAGTLSGEAWSVDVSLGDVWTATGRVDVGAVLRANETPGCLISLIGGRAATGEATAHPAVLEQAGEAFTGAARAQRVRVAAAGHVTTTPASWQSTLTLTLRGRGLGRIVLGLASPFVRKAVRQGLADFWPDTAKDLTTLQQQIAALDARAAEAGGPTPLLHRELWAALRQP